MTENNNQQNLENSAAVVAMRLREALEKVSPLTEAEVMLLALEENDAITDRMAQLALLPKNLTRISALKERMKQWVQESPLDDDFQAEEIEFTQSGSGAGMHAPVVFHGFSTDLRGLHSRLGTRPGTSKPQELVLQAAGKDVLPGIPAETATLRDWTHCAEGVEWRIYLLGYPDARLRWIVRTEDDASVFEGRKVFWVLKGAEAAGNAEDMFLLDGEAVMRDGYAEVWGVHLTSEVEDSLANAILHMSIEGDRASEANQTRND